jgi:regulator of protease activity HflC (stomatin/prohibitin superfamily)
MSDQCEFPSRGRRNDPLVEIQMVFDKVRGHFVNRGPARVSPWLIVAIILLVYAGTGIYIVAPDERGIVLRFGRVVREADPGPGYHLPWPFEQVVKPAVTQILKEE